MARLWRLHPTVPIASDSGHVEMFPLASFHAYLKVRVCEGASLGAGRGLRAEASERRVETGDRNAAEYGRIRLNA